MSQWLMVADKISNTHSMPKVDNLERAQFAIAPPSAQLGDAVALWRRGRGGGLVAIGSIIDSSPEVEPISILPLPEKRKAHRDEGKLSQARSRGKSRIEFRFDAFFLSRSLSIDLLRSMGFDDILQKVKSIKADYSSPHECVELDAASDQWRNLMRTIETACPEVTFPATWNIAPGSVVSRAELHSTYGGNPRTCTSSSGRTPNMFLFVERAAKSPELAPRWSEDALMVQGHVQRGEYISAENLGVLSHLRRGLPLRVFELQAGECLYLGEFVIDQENPVEAWVMTGEREVVKHNRIIWDLQAPLLRLRKLRGVESFVNNLESFKKAPRVGLSMRIAIHDRLAAASSAVCMTSNRSSGSVAGISAIRQVLSLCERDPSVAEAIGDMDEAQALAAIVHHVRRQADISALGAAVENPNSKERDLQKILERMTWIFGGEFLSKTARRVLTVRDQLDFSLIRPGGCLHGVEIKQARIENLVKRQRSHFIVGREINEAVGQAINYLRSLDEQRSQILAELQVDCRRASMTVVIGYSTFVTGGVSSQEVAETIRTYNSHLARVRVVTYDDLLDTARRTLALTRDPKSSDL